MVTTLRKRADVLTVTVRQAKARLSELLAAAEAGRQVLVTRRGRPVAVVSGVDAEEVLREGAERVLGAGRT